MWWIVVLLKIVVLLALTCVIGFMCMASLMLPMAWDSPNAGYEPLKYIIPWFLVLLSLIGLDICLGYRWFP